MNFLPIVTRELRVTSRRSWTYWIRLLFAVSGIAAALLMFYEGPANRTGRGEAMLWLLSVTTLALVLGSGSLLTADSISSEKREDTLGLLFLTPLRGHDIVVGKVAIHAITTACGVLAVLPVFFLPILAGGVTWTETLRVLLAIGVSFLFALCLGVWISTRSYDGRHAVMATLATVAVLVFAPLLWVAFLSDVLRVATPLGAGGHLSPAMLLFFARDTWYTSGSKMLYWTSVGLFLAGAIVFAWRASVLLPATWRLNHKPRPAVEARPAIRSAPARARIRYLAVNPLEQLLSSRIESFAWGRHLQRLIILFITGMLFASWATRDDDPFVFAFMGIFAMHLAAKFAFAFDAARPLNEDKRSSALELLLATPLKELEILSAHAEAFRKRFRPQVRRLILLTLALQLTAIFGPLRIDGEDLFLLSSFIWAPMIWTRCDYKVAPWFALPHALRQSTMVRATARTLAEMVLFPWLPYFPVLFLMATSRADEEFAGLVTFGWAIAGVACQQFRAKRKRVQLLRDFRQLAIGGNGPIAEPTPHARNFLLLRPGALLRRILTPSQRALD